jgi:formyl-CoA transferase
MLVEYYRPGMLKDLRLGYASLAATNARLVYCVVSDLGLSDSLRDKPVFDIVTQVISGMLPIKGEKSGTPVKLGVPLGDLTGGIFGSIGILAALHERQATGRGSLVDISLHHGMPIMLGHLAQLYCIRGKDLQPVSASHPSVVPYGAFPASEGQITSSPARRGHSRGACARRSVARCGPTIRLSTRPRSALPTACRSTP